METMRGLLPSGSRTQYAFAGNATLTVRNPKTDVRFTFRIKAAEPAPGRPSTHFVSLLNGSDNENSYIYVGAIFDAKTFRTTKASKVGVDAPSFRAFAWLAGNWEHPAVEVWHEGVCGRCGRKLTVPESIASGIGPTCAGKEGV